MTFPRNLGDYLPLHCSPPHPDAFLCLLIQFRQIICFTQAQNFFERPFRQSQCE